MPAEKVSVLEKDLAKVTEVVRTYENVPAKELTPSVYAKYTEAAAKMRLIEGYLEKSKSNKLL